MSQIFAAGMLLSGIGCRKQPSRNKIIPDAETALDRRTKAFRWGDDPNGNHVATRVKHTGREGGGHF